MSRILRSLNAFAVVVNQSAEQHIDLRTSARHRQDDRLVAADLAVENAVAERMQRRRGGGDLGEAEPGQLPELRLRQVVEHLAGELVADALGQVGAVQADTETER